VPPSPHITARVDAVVGQSGGGETVRRDLHRPTLHETGRVERTRGVDVEIAIRLLPETGTLAEHEPKVLGTILNGQLAAAEPVDLAVLFVGAEPLVDLAKPVECRLRERLGLRLVERHRDIERYRGTHNLLDAMQSAGHIPP